MFSLGLATGWSQGRREKKPFMVKRIYTGADGKTHYEQVEMNLAQEGTSELSQPVPVTSVIFRRTPPDYFLDWHHAPRRQYVVILSGEGEVELGDGTVVPLLPGDVLLAEDTTGQGHISRGRGSEDRLSLFIPLADQ
jgi:quercetin dioxygenase-like cupin family protein